MVEGIYDKGKIFTLKAAYEKQRSSFIDVCFRIFRKSGIIGFGVDGVYISNQRTINGSHTFLNVEPDKGAITINFGANETDSKMLVKLLRNRRITAEVSVTRVQGDDENPEGSCGRNSRIDCYLNATVINSAQLEKFGSALLECRGVPIER